MRLAFALSILLTACADDSLAPPPLSAPLDANLLDLDDTDALSPPDPDAGTSSDGAAADLSTRDLASHDLKGPPDLSSVDLRATCATVSCTVGVLGDTACKTACGTLTATCGGNPAHCNP